MGATRVEGGNPFSFQRTAAELALAGGLGWSAQRWLPKLYPVATETLRQAAGFQAATLTFAGMKIRDCQLAADARVAHVAKSTPKGNESAEELRTQVAPLAVECNTKGGESADTVDQLQERTEHLLQANQELVQRLAEIEAQDQLKASEIDSLTRLCEAIREEHEEAETALVLQYEELEKELEEARAKDDGHERIAQLEYELANSGEEIARLQAELTAAKSSGDRAVHSSPPNAPPPLAPPKAPPQPNRGRERTPVDVSELPDQSSLLEQIRRGCSLRHRGEDEDVDQLSHFLNETAPSDVGSCIMAGLSKRFASVQELVKQEGAAPGAGFNSLSDLTEMLQWEQIKGARGELIDVPNAVIEYLDNMPVKDAKSIVQWVNRHYSEDEAEMKPIYQYLVNMTVALYQASRSVESMSASVLGGFGSDYTLSSEGVGDVLILNRKGQ